MKKLVSFILILALVLSNMIIVRAEDSVIQSKTATPLDENYNTKITLVLNGDSEENKNLDVVFLMDAKVLTAKIDDSPSEEDILLHDIKEKMITEIYNMINDINNNDKATAHVSLVAYGHGSHTVFDLTDSTTITSKDALETLISSQAENISKVRTGSDLQHGLVTAKEILDGSTSGTNNKDRHVVILTDGGHYTYDNNEGFASSALYRLGSSAYLGMGNMDVNGDVGSPSRNTKSSLYYDETNDYIATFNKLMEHSDDIKARALKGYKFAAYIAGVEDIAKINSLIETNSVMIYAGSDPNDLSLYPYTSMEMGTVMAANEMLKLKDVGYSMHTIGFQYLYGFKDSGDYDNKLLALPSMSFLRWTSTVGQLYLYESTSITIDQLNNTIGDINTDMTSDTIEESSYLIDEMGSGQYSSGEAYDFDLVNDLDKIDIYVDGTKLDKEKINDNEYGFGKDPSLPDGYQFIFRYYPNGTGNSTNELFKLDINTTLTSDKPVQIEYNEVLNENTRKGSEELDTNEVLNASNSTVLHFGNGGTSTYNNPTVTLNGDVANPSTGDNIMIYVTTFVLSSISLVGLLLNKKKILKRS